MIIDLIRLTENRAEYTRNSKNSNAFGKIENNKYDDDDNNNNNNNNSDYSTDSNNIIVVKLMK